MREQDLVIFLTFILLTYLCASIAAAIHLTDKASRRWPRQRRDGGFIILGLFSVIILGALWPLTYPSIWIIRSFVDPDASCFGFNYSRWQNKRKTRKVQRAQDIELERMERAQRLEEQRIREVNEEVERFEAAKARVAVKRATMLGSGAGAGTGRTFQFDQEEELTSTGHIRACPRAGRTRRGAGTGASSASDGEVDIEAQTGMHMPNATVSDARGGRGINAVSHHTTKGISLFLGLLWCRLIFPGPRTQALRLEEDHHRSHHHIVNLHPTDTHKLGGHGNYLAGDTSTVLGEEAG